MEGDPVNSGHKQVVSIKVSLDAALQAQPAQIFQA